MAHLGDRRSWARFEVVGPLGGALEYVSQAAIVNINRTGMLIAADVAPPIDSRLILRLLLGGEHVSVDARVRHFRAVGNDAHSRYLIGFEFLSSSQSLETAIDRIVVAEQS
jgi:PilZ domain-containing protein